MAGARVQLSAWPNETILAKPPSGGKVDMRPVTDVRTDSRGGFALNVNWAALPASHRDGQGTTDFSVVVNDGVHRTSWNMPATQGASGAARDSMRMAASGFRPDTLNFDLGRNASVTSALANRSTTIDRAGKQVTNPGHQRLATSRVAATTKTTQDTCTYYATNRWNNGIYESFARSFGWLYASATFRQSNVTYHRVGTGYSADGSHWSASGSVTYDENAGDSTALFGIMDVWVYNRINYLDFYVTCQYDNHFERRAVSTFAILAKTSYAGHVYYNAGCNKYTTRADITKSTGTDLTYSGGVSLVGIYVEASSGWNTGTNQTWVVTKPSWYCGDLPQGPAASQSVDVGPA